jgi:hypothetical protein
MKTQRDEVKSLIEKTFNENVKGLIPDLRGFNAGHDGAEGDWLTKKMGLTVNGNNEPDFHGFEMKKDSPKTTFGDWAPDEAIYKPVSRGVPAKLARSEFLRIFGTPKSSSEPRKDGRHSWSGEVFPTINGVNKYGQKLLVSRAGDINAIYSFHDDKRSNKNKLVPKELQKSDVILAHWSAEKLKLRLERKFNQLGWFKCLKDSSGKYSSVQFGLPINFESFIKMVRKGEVFCDCGMYDGNPRPYMTWRASARIWDLLKE